MPKSSRRRIDGRSRTLTALIVGGSAIMFGCSQSTHDEGVTIEYVAHAAFRIHSPSGTSVVIDPYASSVWVSYGFPVPFESDAILITHPHYDHDGGRFRGLPVYWDSSMVILDRPGRDGIGDIEIVGIEGKHADPYGSEFGQINTIWVIETGGLRIAHTGDNGPLTADNVSAMGRIDVLMLPIDADYHILSATEIDEIIASVNPRILIPMHYRIPDLEATAETPTDLGEIDPWLAGRDHVTQLAGNTITIRADTLTSQQQIIVLKHSPDVPVTGPDERAEP